MPTVLVMTLFAAAMRERFVCHFHISTICQQSHMSTNFKILGMSIFQPFAINFACQPILAFSTICRIWRSPAICNNFSDAFVGGRLARADEWENVFFFGGGNFNISKICQELTFSPCPCFNHLSTMSHANQFQHFQPFDMKRHEQFWVTIVSFTFFSEHLGEIFGGCKFGAATNPHRVPVWTREHGRDLFLKDTNHSLKKHSPKIKKRFLQTTRTFHARFVVWFTFL